LNDRNRFRTWLTKYSSKELDRIISSSLLCFDGGSSGSSKSSSYELSELCELLSSASIAPACELFIDDLLANRSTSPE
jgi:hypothetical protein